jgi:hypothetical protein
LGLQSPTGQLGFPIFGGLEPGEGLIFGSHQESTVFQIGSVLADAPNQSETLLFIAVVLLLPSVETSKREK